MDLLVSYDCGRYGRARREILDVLHRLGDERAQVERSSVEGIALAHTALDAREVTRGCRSLADQGYTFRFAIKWTPVDYWCETDLDTIRKLLADKVRDRIAAGETWGMRVAKRRWESQHSRDIVVSLARAIDRKVALAHPDKLVRVDVLGGKTAVSVLHPDEIFSIARYHPAAIRTAAPLTSPPAPS
jgi:tRNA(Ser,Leu) C12 N-acetylase TAN1